jgi:hypothetical protein
MPSRAFFVDAEGSEDDGAARLAGVGVFSPVASMPGSPTVSRRNFFEKDGEDDGGGGGGSGSSIGGTDESGSPFVVVLFIIITSSITNTTKADAKPKRNKSKSKSTGILALRRMVVRMEAGVRAGSRRLRFWIARRASKIPAFISADVYLELEHLVEQGRAQMND